jgi:hypothetical protein
MPLTPRGCAQVVLVAKVHCDMITKSTQPAQPRAGRWRSAAPSRSGQPSTRRVKNR